MSKILIAAATSVAVGIEFGLDTGLLWFIAHLLIQNTLEEKE